MTWLAEGMRGAVTLSVDDVHPAAIAAEALGHVQWLQERHPQLRVTLFTTPDWRTIAPYPTGLLARVPLVRDHVFTVPVHPRGTFRLDRHEAFCALLRDWTGAEVALHGLQHVRRGMQPVLEYARRSVRSCRASIEEALSIFDAARLPVARGMAAPGWHATPELLSAMHDAGLHFVMAARDLDTAPSAGALAAGSGLRGVSLFAPQRIAHGLVHFAANFQATSTVDRAVAIIAAGGLLNIKAHLLAVSGNYRALDGLTADYREHLHRVLGTLEERFGDTIWWTSFGELAARVPA